MTNYAKQPDFSQKIARRLAVRINTALLRFRRLSQQYDKMEQSINASLQDYYEALAPLLPYHNQVTPNVPRHKNAVREDMASLDDLIKQLYRHLAKACHPDTNMHHADAMHEVNQAYEAKALGSLMALCHDYLESSVSSHLSLKDLQHYYLHISELADNAQHALTLLEQSEANQLRTKLARAQFTGDDIIGEVAFKLKSSAQPLIYA